MDRREWSGRRCPQSVTLPPSHGAARSHPRPVAHVGVGDHLVIDERRNAFELMRDTAADLYRTHTGSAWLPRHGSLVNRKALTAAMIDSRDFIAAKRRADNEVLLPAGPKIAFSGGDTTDHRTIWAKLDQVHAKHPDMVLMHGGTPKGAEKIAARWADHRGVAQIGFAPDWTRHGRSAPFKRNDQMLEALPKAVVACPGNGINANLVDKARKLGISVWPIE